MSSNLISMDSCKVRIPLEQVKVLNDSLLSHWIPMEVNEETGEMREAIGADFKNKAYYHNRDGISTRFAIEKQVTADQSIKEFLTIGINAKMLKQEYFKGITSNNLDKVHSYLMSLKIASFSFSAFKSAECTDVDYKKDFLCENIDELTLKLQILTIPTKKKGEGHERYARHDNKGIEWSSRKGTAITRAPFMKVYSKELDLKHNSTEFHSNHLQGQSIEYLTRVEFTIKNKKHFRIYEVNNTSLQALTNISQSTLNKMLQNSITKHIERAIRPRKEEEGVTPKEQEIINLIHLLQANRVGLNEAKRGLFYNLKRKTRARREKFFEDVWMKYFSKLPQSQQVNQVENWLSEVGVQFL